MKHRLGFVLIAGLWFAGPAHADVATPGPSGGCGCNGDGPPEHGHGYANEVDRDGDGAFDGPDCDDSNPDVHPGAAEVAGDGIDNDCDGVTDEGADTGDTASAAGSRGRSMPAAAKAALLLGLAGFGALWRRGEGGQDRP